MLCSGCGEFNGISIVVSPASSKASHTGSASSGLMPRRMAMMLRLI
jgi:hypothetical protein